MRVPRRYHPVRLSLLSEGDGLREPFDLDLCDGGGGLHPGTDAVWQGVLLGYGPIVRQWHLHGLHRLWCGLHGGEHVLHERRGVHQQRLPIIHVWRRRCHLQLGLAVL